MDRRMFAVCALVFAVAVTQAQEWQSVKTLYGVTATDVAMASGDTSTLYVLHSSARFGGGGMPILYASTDGGATWEARLRGPEQPLTSMTMWMRLQAGTPDALEVAGPGVDPVTSTSVMRRSTDGGATWSTLYGPIQTRNGITDTAAWTPLVVTHPNDRNIRMMEWDDARNDPTVHMLSTSFDGGQTWNAVPIDVHAPLLAPCPSFPSKLYAVSSTGFFVRTAYDAPVLRLPTTWTGPMPTSMLADDDKSDVVIAAANGGVWRSTDACKNWSNVLAQSTTLPNLSLMRHPNHDGELWTVGSRLYRSVDRGLTFTAVDTMQQRVLALALHDDRSLKSTTDGELILRRSTTSPWDTIAHRLPHFSARSVRRWSDDRWIVIGNYHIAETTDRGSTWTKRLFMPDPTTFKGIVGAVAASPPFTTIYVRSSRWLYRSADVGRTWETIQASPTPTWHAITVDPNDGNHLLGLHTKAIVHSSTGGATWDTVNAVQVQARTSQASCWISSADRNTWLITMTWTVNERDTSMVMITRNGGDMWKTAQLPGGSWDVHAHPSDPNVWMILSATADVFFTTSDAGETWQRTDSVDVDVMCEDPTDRSTLWGLGPTGALSVYHTSTGWQRIASNTLPYGHRVTDVAMLANRTVIATSRDGVYTMQVPTSVAEHSADEERTSWCRVWTEADGSLTLSADVPCTADVFATSGQLLWSGIVMNTRRCEVSIPGPVIVRFSDGKRLVRRLEFVR